MAFIGVISNVKCFENIESEVLNKKLYKNIEVIHITPNSIQNFKNIKFEVILIEEELEKFKDNERNLDKICKSSKYVLVNTDLNQNYTKKNDEKINVITYGLNQSANITVASITDLNLSIYVQKNMTNIFGKNIEIEERRIKINENSILKTYEILIIYILRLICTKSIIKEI